MNDPDPDLVDSSTSSQHGDATATDHGSERERVTTTAARHPVPGSARHDASHLAHTQHGAVSSRQATAIGLGRSSLRRMRRDAGWTSPVQGGLVVPDPIDPLLARARAATLACPDAVVSGMTAARLWQLPCLPQPQGEGPVYLTLPAGKFRAQRRGVKLRWRSLHSDDITSLCGLPITTVARTLGDLVLGLDREHAVSLLDASLYCGVLVSGDLDAVQATITGARRGSAARHGWLELVDGRAESPLESRVRLLLVDAGLASEELQWEVRDARGWFVARLDLAWPSRLVCVEVDGEVVHSSPDALYRDRDRQNRLVSLGWQVLRFTWHDMIRRPNYLVTSVRTHLTSTPPKVI